MRIHHVSSQLLPQWSKRPQDSHKGMFGHLLIIAGSRGMTGASLMVSCASELMGTGLTTLAVPHSCLTSVQSAGSLSLLYQGLPETSEGTFSFDALTPALQLLEGKTAVVIGPGLSRHEETFAFVRAFLLKCLIPVVVDADALNSLEGHTEAFKHSSTPFILTPHPGEFRRLLGSYDPIQRWELALDYQKDWPLSILVLKGARTLVVRQNEIYENFTANPGMAVAGMGDVLSGCIGGLLTQGMKPWDASRLAVYLHGLAGDFAEKVVGQESLLPSSVLQHLPQAIRFYRKFHK
jgi:hydroxyethylthiazole kinase-like uncharacterized protein yjeF